MTSDRRARGEGEGVDVTRLLIDSVTEYAIFVLDPGGVVQTWNRGAERLKGYSRDEIVGRHFSSFYTDQARRAGLPATLLARAERDGSVHDAGWRVRKDGSRFWGSVTITALRDHDGQLVGFAKVTRDMTELHEHEEALAKALEGEREVTSELDRVNRDRARFLAAVVHDLSTPISVVRTSLQLLADDHTAADAPELIEQARRSAEDLEQLRAQLHEYSRLEGGSVELQREQLPVAKLVQRVTEDVGHLVAVPITHDVPADVTVLADELAVRRVLVNLLTNAARYAPPDRPVRIAVRDDGADEVAVGVHDDGPGIDPADQERVFGEFWSGRDSRRPGGGLGLGLSIVRRYVHEHGGRVWIDSGADRGTTFWFTLPRGTGR